MHFKPPYLLSEFIFKTSRSGGKGGQHVNKVATKVLLEFPVASSQLLSEEEKNRLLDQLAGKLTKDGILQIVAQEARSQLENKEIALKKMYNMLNRCFVAKKKRKSTRPSRSAVEKRLTTKKRDAAVKASRRIPFDD